MTLHLAFTIALGACWGLLALGSAQVRAEENVTLVLKGRMILTIPPEKTDPAKMEEELGKTRDEMLVRMGTGANLESNVRNVDSMIDVMRAQRLHGVRQDIPFIYWEHDGEIGLHLERPISNSTRTSITFEILHGDDQLTYNFGNASIKREKNPPSRAGEPELFHNVFDFMGTIGSANLAYLKAHGAQTQEGGRILDRIETDNRSELMVRAADNGTVIDWTQAFKNPQQSVSYRFADYEQVAHRFVPRRAEMSLSASDGRVLIKQWEVSDIVSGADAEKAIPRLPLAYAEVDDTRFERPIQYNALGSLPSDQEVEKFIRDPDALEAHNRDVHARRRELEKAKASP